MRGIFSFRFTRIIANLTKGFTTSGAVTVALAAVAATVATAGFVDFAVRTHSRLIYMCCL
jgi:hypothetical protein